MSSTKGKMPIVPQECNLAKPGVICSFCKECDSSELLFGKFYRLGRINCHHFCLLLSSKLKQNGGDDDGILGFLFEDIARELKRASKYKCYYCGWCTATLSCDYPDCKKNFHLPCGRRNGALNMFADQFQSYCKDHRPIQKVPTSIFANRNMDTIDQLVIPLKRIDEKYKISRNSRINLRAIRFDQDLPSQSDNRTECSESAYLCAICYDDVIPYPTSQSIWSECCRKDSWLHRICVEKLALSAGKHHVRCPLCNNAEVFLEMLHKFGFYVPDQDASWELENGAYQELLERPKECFKEECRCPKGMKYSATKNGPWKLLVCGLCGSQAVHKGCDDNNGRKNVICNRCLPSNRQETLEPNMDELTITTNNEDITLILSDSDSEELTSDRVGNENDLPVGCSPQPENETLSSRSSTSSTCQNTLLSNYETTQTKTLITRLSNTIRMFKDSMNNHDLNLETNKEIETFNETVIKEKERTSVKKKANRKRGKSRKRRTKSVKTEGDNSVQRENIDNTSCNKNSKNFESEVSNMGAVKMEADIKLVQIESIDNSSCNKNSKNFKSEVSSTDDLICLSNDESNHTISKKKEIKSATKGNKKSNFKINKSKSKTKISWSIGKPKQGVNVVLKDGKFCVLIQDGKQFKIKQLQGNLNSSKVRPKKKKIKMSPKSELTSSGYIETSPVNVNSSTLDQVEFKHSEKLSPPTPIKRTNKKKLFPDKGQKQIMAFFKAIPGTMKVKQEIETKPQLSAEDSKTACLKEDIIKKEIEKDSTIVKEVVAKTVDAVKYTKRVRWRKGLVIQKDKKIINKTSILRSILKNNYSYGNTLKDRDSFYAANPIKISNILQFDRCSKYDVSDLDNETKKMTDCGYITDLKTVNNEDQIIKDGANDENDCSVSKAVVELDKVTKKCKKNVKCLKTRIAKTKKRCANVVDVNNSILTDKSKLNNVIKDEVVIDKTVLLPVQKSAKRKGSCLESQFRYKLSKIFKYN